ncbi:hypothetical protein B4U79_08686 [Dinothrombium tinctorium]|uniref:AAA+ ATPase domain-containing protein n=1 Tax=Dinothrombium tinctorium TaxID=1965070 RepID=A0A443QRP9_9ACAR|nr:hypothetical protein B4U79_08686 [Dinothrombium tinctorium]
MSWLFGIGKQTPQQPQMPDFSGGASGSGDNGDKDSKSSKSFTGYHFDSSGFEKAAKAAKELERSVHAKDALELSKMRELTQQMELQAKAKEYEAAIEQAKVEQKRIDYEERRKTLQEEAKLQQQKVQYQDQLARKRYEDQLLLQQKANEENLRRQEESVAKQEAMRKSTLEYEAELKHKNDLKRIEAEIRAQAIKERENREIYLEQLKLKAAEDRITKLDSIKTIGDIVGVGFNNFISNWDKVVATATGVTLFAAGIYGAKYGTGVLLRAVEARIGKPSLVRETSRLNFIDSLRHPIKTTKRLILSRRPEDALKGVILKPSLEEQLRDVAIATRNTKRNRGFYRNFLFHGPPGTGKSLFAKKLALHSGMDYALLSGADIAPMKKDGVLALQKLFDWAKTSRRGLLVFIDEADAFMRKRSSDTISEDLRSTINEILYFTGDKSSSYMLVFATNTPEQFDFAVSNRMNRIIKFELPTLDERERLVRLYFDDFVLKPAAEGKRRLKVEHFDYNAVCSKIAQLTEGFSGREISNLALEWQVAAYVSKEGILTEKMVMDTVYEMIEEHKQRVAWESEEEARKRDPWQKQAAITQA